MRVLHAYRTYFPDTQGGLEEVIRQICLNTKSLGAESRILTLSNDPQPKTLNREEARVYRQKLSFEIASCGMSASALPEFKRLVDWADVVHYHFPWPFADMLHFAAKVSKPTVLTYHSDIVRQKLLSRLYQPLMTRFLESIDRIVCTSPNYFVTSNVLAGFSDKVEVIPIGLNEDSYERPPENVFASTRAKYGEDFFLFVGVLRYYKGLHILLDAIKEAPYRIVIVGSGPTETALKRQAKQMGLRNVVFTGYIPDDEKLSLFHLSRGVVFPSYMRAEAFGVTLLEGAMCSRPLISTEVGSGTSHVNIDGDTGFVVPPGSPKSLRTAMDQLWHRPDVARHMGRNARKRYEQLFSGRLMAARYYELYGDLAETADASEGAVQRVVDTSLP